MPQIRGQEGPALASGPENSPRIIWRLRKPPAGVCRHCVERRIVTLAGDHQAVAQQGLQTSPIFAPPTDWRYSPPG